ncbi:hypothetical protein D9M71_817590 [compost metagenome]
MPLHANSTALKTIFEDAFPTETEPHWQNISTADQPLVELWKKHNKSSEILSGSTNISEVIVFRSEQSDD